jgi:hypothetical protein
MKPSKQAPAVNSVSSILSGVFLLSALFCVPVLALSGCGSGNSASSLALPSASSLPESCTAATVGVEYACDITVTGGSAPFSWTASGLPAGLTSNADTDTTSTLTISGTPQAAAAARAASTRRPAGSAGGTSNVQIGVTDSKHHIAHLNFTITTSAPAALSIITTSPLTGGTAGTSYSTSVTASGGTPPYTWNFTGLPSGLTFSSGTPSATISGTTDNVGTSSVMASVTDSAATPATVHMTFSLTIAQATALMVSTTSLPSGTVNASYSQTLDATGGVKPYKWALMSGSLPSGFNLSMAGVISGSTSSMGTSSFTVKVTDSESPAQTATQALSITINPVGAALSITTTSPLTGATLGTAYTTMVAATGGTPPYTFTLASSSALPAGLALTSGTPSATIHGTPTATGTFQFTINVSDSATTPAMTSASFLLTVTGSSTLNCPPTVNLTICGTYALGVRGVNSSGGPTAFGVVFTANNSGDVISGNQASNDSVNGFKTMTITGGSYTMDSSGDGRGILTLISSTAAVTTFRFALESAANPGPGPIVEFDTSGDLAEGIMAGPETTPVPKFPANLVFALPLDGVNGAGQLSGLLGEFEIGANACDGTSGSFNSRQPFVTNTAGTVVTGLTAVGSCTAADANGIGTAQFTISGGTPFTTSTLHFTYLAFGIGTTFAGGLFLGTDAIGTNQPIFVGLGDPNTNVGAVNGPALAGFCPCLFNGQATTDGTFSGKPVGTIIRILASSSGGSTGTVSGVVDENAGGTLITQGAWPYSAFTIDSDGVGTFTGTGQKTIHFILGSQLYTMDESAQVRTGSINAQNATSIGSPNQNYIFGAEQASSNRGKIGSRLSGIIKPSGAASGTFTGTVDAISSAGSFPGASVTGNYSSLDATTGRGTGTASLTGGSAVNVVVYAARNRRFLILDKQSNTPVLTGARLQ